jgi:hypothetical protein
MSKTVKFKNRYGDVIKFERIADDKVKMTGYLVQQIRCGVSRDTSVLEMVDPNGGPMIQIGTDLSEFGSSGVVKSITLTKKSCVFTIQELLD